MFSEIEEVESVDILGGKGMFTTISAFEENWQLAVNTTANQYTFEVQLESASLNKTEEPADGETEQEDDGS